MNLWLALMESIADEDEYLFGRVRAQIGNDFNIAIICDWQTVGRDGNHWVMCQLERFWREEEANKKKG